MKHQNVIIVNWKKRKVKEAYSSLVAFTQRHKQFKTATISECIGRKKKPYRTDEIHIERVNYFQGKPKQK